MALPVVSPYPVPIGGGFTIRFQTSPGRHVSAFFQATVALPIPIPVESNGEVVTADSNGIATWNWQALGNIPTASYILYIIDADTGESLVQPTSVAFAPGGGIFGIDPMTLLLGGGILVGALFIMRRK